MDENEINDIRKQSQFKGITFSKFKKSEVKKELLKALFKEKIEPACYWCAEFICAGHYVDVWDILLNFMSNNIHLGNPKLPIYIDMRFTAFKEILTNGYIGQELRMRNNDKIRMLFAEIISILALSKKKNSFDSIKVEKNDFYMTQLTEKLQADNIQYVQEIFRPGDPKELFIALNELAFHLSKRSQNKITCCYWIEWILAFERTCKAKKKNCSAQRRAFIPIDSKYQKEVIWMVWELLLSTSTKHSTQIKSIVHSLLNLFCIRYTPAVKRKRKYILYFAISLLTEHVDLSIPLYTDQSIIEKVKSKINVIYKQVKKNEESPNTSYLFTNTVAEKNLEKTIKKLEVFQKLSNIITRQ